MRAHLLAVEQLGIDAVQAHGVAAPRVGVALGVGMVEVEHAALAHHGVVVEVLLQPLPELHRPFVERRVAGQQVVGADDRGVAADVAGADLALLQHRDVGDAVHLGQVVGRRQPVSAAADDDDVVGRPWARRRATRASSPCCPAGPGRGWRRWNSARSVPTLHPSSRNSRKRISGTPRYAPPWPEIPALRHRAFARSLRPG